MNKWSLFVVLLSGIIVFSTSQFWVNTRQSRHMVIMDRESKENIAMIDSQGSTNLETIPFFPVFCIFSFYLTPKRSIENIL